MVLFYCMTLETDKQPKPVFCDESEAERLKGEGVKVTDAFSYQIKELFFIENPSFVGQDKAKVYETKDFKKFSEKKSGEFNYVYYPWLNHLVKCVKHEDYFKLKTNRNQDLITAEEQRKLYDYKIAVLGMSVGSNIAFVLTQAGISREVVLADFDDLDTTNLNRILAGVHEVGLNKSIVGAHKIYEDNPYSEVTLLTEGVNENNLEELLKAGKIDCIIEEVDNLLVKIATRELAIRYKVPVLMITDNGDGIVLHIERYDLGYDKIFHHSVNYWKDKVKELGSKPDKKAIGEIITNEIIGGIEKVDPKMVASVERVFKKELVSWSQLGSAAVLAGVYATFAVKKIALGEDRRLEVRSHINLSY